MSDGNKNPGIGRGRGRGIGLTTNPATENTVGGSGRVTMQQVAAALEREYPTNSGVGGSIDGGEPAPRENVLNDDTRMQLVLPNLYTRPPGLTSKKGEGGRTIACLTNYIRVILEKDFRVYQYHMLFSPPVDSKSVRIGIMRSEDLVDIVGENLIYDGMILYQAKRLPVDPLICVAHIPGTETKVTVTIKYTTEFTPTNPQCLTIFNLCIRHAFEWSGYSQLGRNFYHPESAITLPSHRIEVWPGFISSIRVHERDLLLACELSHKVLRQDTVYELIMHEMRRDPAGGQKRVWQLLIGCTVMTRYNNKTYRIDDVAWDMSPESTFTSNDGVEMTFIEYYDKNYHRQVRDKGQPLLVSRPKRSGSEITFYLVPEFCAMTGLTDAMRENYQIMSDLAKFTRVPPQDRIKHLRNYLQTMSKNPRAMRLFSQWGLTLDSDAYEIQARELPRESIIFGNNRSIEYQPESAEWAKECRQTILDDARPLDNWAIVFAQSSKRTAEEFYNQIGALGPRAGITVAAPTAVQLRDDSEQSYVQGIKDAIDQTPHLEMVVTVVPNDNKARYDAIKKYCCLDREVPSQVIREKSLEKNTVSVCSKILLQMNCKLGGSLWRVKLPLPNTMIIGYDLYHDSSSNNKTVGSAVFSMNAEFSKWFSKAALHSDTNELIDNLTEFCKVGLSRYQKINGELPDRIILFRDGVGDGHIPVVVEKELPRVQEAFKSFCDGEYNPKFAFIIVTKHVNTRYFKKVGDKVVNPAPGTVVDDGITRPERYDFYLVPQAVRQGTVTPVSYNVIYDTTNMPPSRMQLLSYKLCHLYYNWQGTIRVPAPCQFAHKLAFLVGQSLHRPVGDYLADKMFYL